MFVVFISTFFAVLVFIQKLLLWYPTLLHKRKTLGPKGNAKLIGHRGSRLEGVPENTIAAFKDSINAGAEVIELDVWLSKDHKVVVHHDERFTRMCGGGNSSELTDSIIHQTEFKDFPRIIPYPTQCERCSHFSEDEITRIPLFEEVLRTIPDSIAINIEFKQNSNILISEVHRLLIEAGHNRKTNVFWFSLDDSINKKLISTDPSIPAVVSVVGMLKIFALYYSGLLPFFPIEYGVFGIPVTELSFDRINRERALSSLPLFIKSFLAYLLAGRPPHLLVSKPLFTHLRERGLAIWFMDVEGEEDIVFSAAAGATGILTDQIRFAKNVLVGRKHVIRFKENQ